jgi:hypothetical protein
VRLKLEGLVLRFFCPNTRYYIDSYCCCHSQIKYWPSELICRWNWVHSPEYARPFNFS